MSTVACELVAAVVTPRVRVNAARALWLSRQRPWRYAWVFGGAAVVMALILAGFSFQHFMWLVVAGWMVFILTPQRRAAVKEPCVSCGGELAMLPREKGREELSSQVKACLYCGTDFDGGERHEPECRHAPSRRSARQELERRRWMTTAAVCLLPASIAVCFASHLWWSSVSLFAIYYVLGINLLESCLQKREQCLGCGESLKMLPAESRWRFKRARLAREVSMCPFCCENLR